KIRPDAVQRVGHAALHSVRVQVVHQKQTRDQTVVGEGLRQFRSGGNRQPQHAFEAGAVEVGDLADELFGTLTRPRPSARAGVEQGLDPIARRAPTRLFVNLVWTAIGHGSLAGGGLRWGMQSLERAALAQVHVHTTGQTRVEAAHRAHDVDALEVLPVVLLEDGLALYRILVWPRRAEAVARVGIPRGRRVRVIVGDLAVADHHVVAQYTTHRLGEAAADAFLGH